jgi:prepilin-type N-terminal cleavage/methylation domain-containing protein
VVTISHPLRRDGGFTLVEMLSVVLILGLLSGIAVVAVSGAQRSSTVKACETDWRSVDSAIKAYGTDHLIAQSGQPDYSGLATNPMQALASAHYLFSTEPSAPNRYAQSVSVTGGGSGYSILISATDGNRATTLTELSTSTDAATACSTAIGS